MSSNSLTKTRTIWTLNPFTKPFTWETTTIALLPVGDPFAFDHFVWGERILDTTAYHAEGGAKVQATPYQWSDDDATGVEIHPPPVFPIVEDYGGDDRLSEADKPECCSPPTPSSHQVLAEDTNPPDQLSDDDEYDSERDYPDDWDDDWYGPVDVLSDDPIPPRQYSEPADNTKLKHRLDTIKRFISTQQELPQTSRVDTVMMRDPMDHDFIGLDGLTFKHLALETGVTLELDLTPIAHLSNSWSAIESVLLNNIHTTLIVDRTPESGTVAEQWTAIPPTIKSLQLEFSTVPGFDFRHPKGGFRSLQNLKLFENDAVDLFCKAWRQLPNFTTQIKVLHIISTTARYDMLDYSIIDFRRRLRSCTNVETLLLALDFTRIRHLTFRSNPKDPDTKLSDCIPSSVQNLSFHFTRSDAMLEDLNIWLEMSRNSIWLPRLRCIRLKTDAERQGCMYNSETKPEDRTPFVEDPRFETKIKAIYDVLSLRNPPVRILD